MDPGEGHATVAARVAAAANVTASPVTSGSAGSGVTVAPPIVIVIDASSSRPAATAAAPSVAQRSGRRAVVDLAHERADPLDASPVGRGASALADRRRGRRC